MCILNYIHPKTNPWQRLIPLKTISRMFQSIVVISLVNAPSLYSALVTSTSTSSMKNFVAGAEKLTIYTDVPEHLTPVIKNYKPRAKSDIYEIWVRSAATDNQWHQCFASMTFNRGLEMDSIAAYTSQSAKHGYQNHTMGWTHTYANIEMSEGSTVEVEIRKIGNEPLNNSNVIFKSAVHPEHKIIVGTKKKREWVRLF